MRETCHNGRSLEAPRERVPESAAFDTARVRGPRFQPPILVAGFLVLLVTIVALGVGGQVNPATTPRPNAALASNGVPVPTVAAPSAAPSSGPSAQSARGPRATPPAPAPVMTSGPGPIQIVAQRSTAGMFIHGDVFASRVTWVYVSVSDDSGIVAGWASVSVPGAAGASHGAGPALRFDIEIAVPAAFNGRLWVTANAYNDAGEPVGSTRLATAALLRPRMQFEP